MRDHLLWLLGALALAGTCHAAERINHVGRILGPVPTVATSTLFNTTQADAVLAAMQIMPRDNPWNEDIRNRPVAADSAAIIARISADLLVDRRPLHAFHEMNFALIPAGQAKEHGELPRRSMTAFFGTACGKAM